MTSPTGPRLFPEVGREVREHDRGVLPFEHLRALVADGVMSSSEQIDEGQLQPASIDLRLGAYALQVRASFLPGRGTTVLEATEDLLVQRISLEDGAVLQKGAVYIIPLLESLDLAGTPGLLAKANPKSTTGRLDVFARLITDRADQFDIIDRGYQGPLFAEVSPKTFNVRVRQGTRLNQLRFVRGRSASSHASRRAADEESLVFDEHGEPIKATVDSGIWFSVDLSGSAGDRAVGWKARGEAPVIDLERIGYYDPEDFWEAVRPSRQLILTPDAFYILGSKERVRVPPTYAAEMLPYDQAMGEFRVHYAGFFDPGFGYGAGELQGTRAILEVRSHEIPYALKDGQRIGRLMYERMLAVPERLYGAGAGSSYQDQGLGLSKQFKRSLTPS
ncbi:MAG: 2'-deoxycytidine 5'-triphosphate deaminase [Dehalococcoidia bacterium]|nr:2'-deoxycytidine 5'-triphosphate deaminase [Dehalococcoidia bacterium]